MRPAVRCAPLSPVRPVPLTPPPSTRAASLRRGLALLPAALAALLSPACNDNVGCVFAANCDQETPLAEFAAARPVDGDFVSSARPEIVSTFPTGQDNRGTTPVVLVFSESMQEESVFQGVELVGAPLGGVPPPAIQVERVLLADARVLVLLPSTADPLDPGAYSLRLAMDANLLDLTGQAVDLEPDATLASFTVSSTPPAVPRLVTTFPPAGASGQSELTEIVAVFDREIAPASVTAASFDVRVNDADPTPDPVAAPLDVGGQADTRVFRYRRVDADDVPLAFGRSADVELSLSPSSARITDTDGNLLPATTAAFTTAAFSPPVSARILSQPPDAIGSENLSPGANELRVEVTLDAAAANDQIDLFLFGDQERAGETLLVALAPRTQRLSAPAGTFTFTRDVIALERDGQPVLEDGPVTFAFAVRRGNASSPVRVLDLDPDPATILDPALDTTAPRVASWLGTGSTAEFRSDLRGLSLAGNAGEPLSRVAVATAAPAADNGEAPVVGANGGLFLAAPVPLPTVAPGPVDFTARAFDHARNAATEIASEFLQVGALGGNAFTPGDELEVEVFDAASLEPLPSIGTSTRVLVHADLGGGVYALTDTDTTGPDGRVTLTTAGAPAVGAIVTVVRNGYDLFTLHGVPTTRLSIPLRAVAPSASAAGDALTSTALSIAGLDRRYDDSRRSAARPRGFTGADCAGVAGGIRCGYGDEPIAALRLGARSFFAGDLSQTSFDVASILQAFALALPQAPTAPGATQRADIEVEGLLPAAGDPHAAQAVPEFHFRLPAASGLGPDFQDPGTTGELFADVEVLVPGLPGALAVGPGISFALAPDLWSVRAAYPGIVGAAGELGGAGLVDPDPFVRAELVDTSENAVGVRPRVSTVAAAGTPPELVALRVPTVLAPAPGASSGAAFDVVLAHAIGDERSEGGLYRVDLEDAAGRGWSLWRFDPAGSADVVVRAVDVAEGGAAGLADGAITATASAFAWSGLVPSDFFWTDVEREFELFSRAAPVSFQKP